MRSVRLEPRRPRFDLDISGEDLGALSRSRLDKREPPPGPSPSRRRGRRPRAGRGRLSRHHPKEGSPGLLPAAILVRKCAHVGHKRAPRKRRGRARFQTSSGRGSTSLFCGINPGRFSDAAAAHFANPRNDFWRLLHDGRVHAAAARADRAVRASSLRRRRHERRGSHDAGSSDLPANRLRRFGRAARAHRAGARPAFHRVRRQGGLPRSLRGTAGARAPGSPARRHGPLRPAFDLSRERRGAL